MTLKSSYPARHTLGPALALASLCLAALTACGGGDGAAPPGGANTSAPPSSTQSTAPATLDATKTCNISNFAPDLLERVNQVRRTGATCGSVVLAPDANRKALAWNNKLFEAAAAHAQDMVTRNFFDHRNPDGAQVDRRVSAQGYPWSFVAENIAAGQPGIESVMNSWLTSAGHCSNIMEPTAQEIGVACVVRPSDGRLFWAMVEAAPAR